MIAMLKLFKKHFILLFSITIITVILLFLRISYVKLNPEQYDEVPRKYYIKFIPEIANSIENSLFDISNFSFLIKPNIDICSSPDEGNRKIKAVFIVTSHINNVEVRSAMRRAFSKKALKKLGVRRVFLLGLTSDNKYINQKAIEDEESRFGDLVQGNFYEAYRNLTYKHLMGFKWVNRYCDKAQFVVKMDDDIVVNLMKLLKLLEKFNETEEFISGYVLKKLEVKRIKANKWYVTKEEYAQDTYPNFVSGWLYITTSSVTKKLEQLAAHEKYFWIDDVFITGILAQKLNLRIYDIKEFFTDHPEYFQCCLNDYTKQGLDCDVIVGPNGGRTNLFYEFNSIFSMCDRKKCNERLYKVNETCTKLGKIENLGRGNAVISSYKLAK